MIPASLKDRVLQAARQSPSPSRSRRRLPAPALAALAGVVMLAIFLLWGGFSHSGGRPPEVAAFVVLGVVLLAALVTRLAMPSARSMLPPPSKLLFALCAAVPLAVGIWLAAWHTAYTDPFTRLGFRCLALTLQTAPWPFAALLLAGPRLVPDRPWLMGAALGAAAGAWAAVVVELWCPLAEPAHVAVGHVLPLAVVIAAGAAAGARWLKLRAL